MHVSQSVCQNWIAPAADAADRRHATMYDAADPQLLVMLWAQLLPATPNILVLSDPGAAAYVVQAAPGFLGTVSMRGHRMHWPHKNRTIVVWIERR